MQMNRIVLPLYLVHNILEQCSILSFHDFFYIKSSLWLLTEETIFPGISLIPCVSGAHTQKIRSVQYVQY